MQPVLFDSSIYIMALRMKDDATLSLRRIAGSETDMAECGRTRGIVCRGDRARGAMLWSGWSVILIKPDGSWFPILVTGLKPGKCSLVWPQSTITSK